MVSDWTPVRADTDASIFGSIGDIGIGIGTTLTFINTWEVMQTGFMNEVLIVKITVYFLSQNADFNSLLKFALTVISDSVVSRTVGLMPVKMSFKWNNGRSHVAS